MASGSSTRRPGHGRGHSIGDPAHNPPHRSSTPMTHKISSVRFTSQEPSLKVDTLNAIMQQELENAIINNAPSLIEAVFPNPSLLSGNLDSLIKGLKFPKAPGIVQRGEEAVADWMNEIGSVIEQHTQSPILRKWSALYCNTPLKDTPHSRKPDIMLLDANIADSLSEGYVPKWFDVRGLSEVTSQESFHSTLKSTVTQKSYLVFLTQGDRRYVTTLSFHGKQFRFTVCDRAGVIHSKSLPITWKNGRINPTLLRIIIGFMFATESDIGYDWTMARGPDGQIIKIKIKDKEYEVVRRVFSSETLRGRATQCWHVRINENGNMEEYIIKDSWVHTGRTANEIGFLEKLRDIEGVPRCIDAEDVTLPNGVVDSTVTRRVGLAYSEVRVHRRLAMQPVGQPLTTFTCKKELVGAFRDLARGMYL